MVKILIVWASLVIISPMLKNIVCFSFPENITVGIDSPDSLFISLI